MVGQIELTGGAGLLNMRFQPGPARKSTFACNGELRVTEAPGGSEYFLVGSSAEARMKLPDLLGDCRIARSVAFEQIFCLVFKVVDAGIWRKRSNGHNELP